MTSTILNPKLILFLLLGNIAWISAFNFYMQRRTGIPETIDSKWWRIAFGLVLVGYFIAGFDWIAWIGNPTQQFVVVQLAFVILSTLVGASTKRISLFFSFGLIVAIVQACVAELIPAGSFVSDHLGATLLLMPLLIIPLFAEGYSRLVKK